MDDQALRDNMARVHARIAAAEQRVNRVGQVTLIAVSKMQPVATVAAAYRAGLRIFGENRVDEAGSKAEAIRSLLPPDGRIEWHMIGHLQSRQAAGVLPWAAMVHSVDTIKLAGRLSRATTPGQTLPILLEVNVSGEASKAGLRPQDVAPAVETILELPGLRIDGLMTMAPIVDEPEQARPVFRDLAMLRERLRRQYPALPWTHLSMGMTDDFEVAIEEGATLVRIGRAIFGER